MKYGFAPNMRAFLQQLRSKRCAEATVQTYERALRYFKEYVKSQGIKDDVRAVSQDLANRYRHHILSDPDHSNDWKLRFLLLLCGFYKWLAAEGVIVFNPAAKMQFPALKRRKLPPYLTQNDVKKLLEAADPEIPAGLQTPAGVRDRAILETMYSTGIRSSECFRLGLGDINFTDGLVRINCGKGSKDRVVPIGDAALGYIQRYITEVRGGRAGPMFRKPVTGAAIDAYDLRQILSRCSRKAGLKIAVNPHLLRHSFAVHLLENGADIRHIQEMLGHEHLIATQIYTRIVPVELKKVHAAAHPAARRKEKLPADLQLDCVYKNAGPRKR